MNWSRVALALVLIWCAYKTVHAWKNLTLEDFRVYETAATLVRGHQSLRIYDGADGGVDPQLRWADRDSLFAREARSIGIPNVQLYVYPPVLADLITPWTLFSMKPAGRLWTGFNVALLGIFCVWMFRYFGGSLRSLLPVALVLGTITFNPVLDCLRWGQIVIVLLLLWTTGVLSYARGWIPVSAVALALATGIKLTPLLVVVPMLLWKEWRWLRIYFATLFGIFSGTVAINGWGCLQDCFRHVIPAMSNGLPSPTNRTFLSACQQLYVTWTGGDPRYAAATHIPASVLVAAKGVDAGLILLAAVYVARSRSVLDARTRAVVLSLFAMLSVVVSPVSWEHAYAVCLLTFVLLWEEAVRLPVAKAYVVLLALASMELNWFALSFVIRRSPSNAAFCLAAFCPVVFTLALVFYRLAAFGRFAEWFATSGAAVRMAEG